MIFLKNILNKMNSQTLPKKSTASTIKIQMEWLFLQLVKRRFSHPYPLQSLSQWSIYLNYYIIKRMFMGVTWRLHVHSQGLDITTLIREK
jgi:hypothetical protein